MAKFDLASVLGDLSKLDTGIKPDGREQIEYIDLGLIDPDPNNFYELSGLEELAANIELLGLQQPLRVRPNPEQPGRWIIVSGHRRRAALAMLAADGKTQFAQVPCIREAAAGSAALQELRLIYANSDTRKLTSAEISKQAERVEALLYQLKEEGMDFPGRMRDHVAEACKVSRSKLARLKVIRDGLAPDIRSGYWEPGMLNEASAYELARMSHNVQRCVIDHVTGSKKGDIGSLSAYRASEIGRDYARLTTMDCPAAPGESCCNVENCVSKLYARGYRGYEICGSRCCYNCDDLVSCTKSCNRLAFVKKDKKAEMKAEKEKIKAIQVKEAAAREDKEKKEAALTGQLWRRMGAACNAAGVNYGKLCEQLDIRCNGRADALMDGSYNRIDKWTGSPLYSVDAEDIMLLSAMADALGVSVDYLFCRTDAPVPKVDTDAAGTAAPVWRKGTPDKSGLLVAVLVADGLVLDADVYRYDAEQGRFLYELGFPMDDVQACIKWLPLPEV